MGTADRISQSVIALVHGCHHRDIRQMRTTVCRVIGQDHVAVAHRQRLAQRPHTQSQRPEMHRHVRRVHDQVAVRIEQRTGVIQPLLHVRGDRRPLEHLTHLGGDGGKSIRK